MIYVNTKVTHNGNIIFPLSYGFKQRGSKKCVNFNFVGTGRAGRTEEGSQNKSKHMADALLGKGRGVEGRSGKSLQLFKQTRL